MSGWIFFNDSFSALWHACVQTTQGKTHLCHNMIMLYVLYTRTQCLALYLILRVCVSMCMCASSLGFLSDHRECDKWMCQGLMEHCDCSARHKAITRLYRQPQRKILFQSTTHNLGDKERCSTVDRESQALFLK